jgi:hypothetical protein
MCRCVVVGPVRFLVSASLAVREEFLVPGDVDADPDFTGVLVSSIDVSSEFVFAAEPIFVIVAVLAVGFGMHRSDVRCFRDLSNFFQCSVR